MTGRVTRGKALIGALALPSTGKLSIGGVAGNASAAELNKSVGVDSAAYQVQAADATFTETTGAGVYTGSVNVPAGASILDIIIQSTALWTAATSATMKVGDVADDDGWYTGVDLKATDLLTGEDLSFAHDGGKAGAYLASEQRKRYASTARVISGIVTTVGASGNAGRTRMLVVYAAPTPVAATKV